MNTTNGIWESRKSMTGEDFIVWAGETDVCRLNPASFETDEELEANAQFIALAGNLNQRIALDRLDEFISCVRNAETALEFVMELLNSNGTVYRYGTNSLSHLKARLTSITRESKPQP